MCTGKVIERNSMEKDTLKQVFFYKIKSYKSTFICIDKKIFLQKSPYEKINDNDMYKHRGNCFQT